MPILCGFLLAAVWLQWWLIGKWLDRILLHGLRYRSARYWAAVFLGGPVFMWLAYWTPIAQHVLIVSTLLMLLIWLFLLLDIPITWKKVRMMA